MHTIAYATDASFDVVRSPDQVRSMWNREGGGEALRMWIDGVNGSLVRCPRLLLL